MADLADVLTALGELIGAALYPTPPTAIDEVSPTAGVQVLVMEGWPLPGALDCNFKEKKVVVSIYPLGRERNVTRFEEEFVTISINQATFAIVADGQILTLSGAQPSGAFYPHNIVAFINGAPFLYQTTAADTLKTATEALGALILAAFPGTVVAGSSGQISVPLGPRIGRCTVGTIGRIAKEIRTVERTFQITIWGYTPAVRDAVGPIIDLALSNPRFLTLPDGFKARIKYIGSPFTDFEQKQGVFRRDLLFSVEYGLTIAEAATQIVEPRIALGIDGVASERTIYG